MSGRCHAGEKATWNNADRVELDRSTAARNRRIGTLGESLAEEALRLNGFVDVKNLNITKKYNHPGADIYAERNGFKYWISVKCRNKYTEAGELNPRYRVNRDVAFLEKLVSDDPGSKMACVAISLVVSQEMAHGGEPAPSYSCYLLELTSGGRTGILMGPRHLEKYEQLILNGPLPQGMDWSELANRYSRRKPGA